jgi:dUTP pyrophosphatase
MLGISYSEIIAENTPFYFTRVRDVLSPTRGTPKSAGIDFYVPKFTDEFLNDLIIKNNYGKRAFELATGRWIESNFGSAVGRKPQMVGFTLYSQERVLIPSGIHVKLPDGFALIAHNKSGVATKHGLDRLAEVVDEDYQGEVHISIFNSSNSDVVITENMKLIQFILIPVLYAKIQEVESLEKLYPAETERGAGGFGSTDKK